MLHYNHRLIYLLGCLLLLATVASAQDWPQWRGANRDGKVLGFTAPQTWPKEFSQLWKVKVGTGDASPVLVGDKVYVFACQADQEMTSCFNAADGTLSWQDKYTAPPVTGASSRHPGPRSTPTVAAGKIVTLGATGTLSCLDALNGKLLWRKDIFPHIVPMFFTAMSPLIIDNQVIAQLGGKGNGGIIDLDLITGEEKWRWMAEGPEYGSPVLMTVAATTQIVTLTEKSLVGVNLADGKLLWSIPFVPHSRAYNAVTPIIDGQTVYYSGATRGTHALKIAKQGDLFNTTELWSNPDVSVQFNTPILKDGHIYGLSDQGFLFCLNAQSGNTNWLDTNKTDSGGFCALLDVGSVLLALPGNGQLIAFKPDEKAYTELARIKVADTATYAIPIISGNRIFVKDQDSLTLWLLK